MAGPGREKRAESSGGMPRFRPTASQRRAHPVREGKPPGHANAQAPADDRHWPYEHDAGCSCRPRTVAVRLAGRPPAQRRVGTNLVVGVHSRPCGVRRCAASAPGSPRSRPSAGGRATTSSPPAARTASKNSATRPARSSASAPPGSTLQHPPKKIPLDGELSDLGMQLVDLRLMLPGELPPPTLGEHFLHASSSCRFQALTWFA